MIEPQAETPISTSKSESQTIENRDAVTSCQVNQEPLGSTATDQAPIGPGPEPTPGSTSTPPADGETPPGAAGAPVSDLPAPESVRAINPIIGTVRRLSDQERADYQGLQATVRKGWQSWFEVGMALAEIRDRELYREEFESFEQYYHIRWGFQRTKAYGLISAAQVFSYLSSLPDVPKPEHESQLRPLLGLSPAEAQLAWQFVASMCNGRLITAQHVKKAVHQLQLDRKASVKPPTPRTNKKEVQRMISASIGELLMLLSQKANHEILITKVEALDRLIRTLVTPRKR